MRPTRLRIALLALLAVVPALVLCAGGVQRNAPAAHADTTDVVVIGCEFIAGAIDGDPTNSINNLDVQTACGGDAPGTHVVGYGTELPPTGARSVTSLANAIGNQDGVLTPSDFRTGGPIDESYDANQLSTDCTHAASNSLGSGPLADYAAGLACTLDVFVFVNHDQSAAMDLPTGLKSIESQSLSATCGVGFNCALPAAPVNLDFNCLRDDRAKEGVAFSITSSGNAAVVGGIASTSTATTNPDVITTVNPHGLVTGDTVSIAGATDTAVNGVFVVTVTSATTFTIPVTATVAGGAVGSVTQLNNSVINTAAAHGLSIGDVVTISGSSDVTLNGQWRVNSAPSTTSFTVGNGFLNGGADRIASVGGGGAASGVRDWAVGSDNDCNGGQSTLGIANNGDGVIMFHVLEDTASRGSVLTVTVEQDAVAQTFDANIVGTRNNVDLTLAESAIETNGSAPNVSSCQTATAYTAGIAPPTSTLAWAITTDQDNTVLTRVPVSFSITPPVASGIAKLGLGSPGPGVVPNTFFTIRPRVANLPTAAYEVICGGVATGTATVDAAMSILSCAPAGCATLSSMDHSATIITTGGAPSSVALTAAPTTIVCNGTNTSTVAAHVTDILGQDVADGVPVNFSIVALGTANPINTVTKNGVASSVITPLPGTGTSVIVTAGDSGVASVVQTSINVMCTTTTPTPSPTPTPAPCNNDGDCDGIPDALDNCPATANPDQANTNLFNFAVNRPGSDPRGDVCDPDISGDGYGNARKLALHKNLLIYCPIMRADVDGDGAVSILDLTKVAQWFVKSIPPAPQRYAQDADSTISILDLTKMAQVFIQNVSACP